MTVLYINICSFSTIFIYMLTLAHDSGLNKMLASLGQEGQNLTAKQKGFSLVV